MKFEKAEQIAKKLLEILAPECSRITIAGSIRRRKPEVGDIEIVCIPNKNPIKPKYHSNGFCLKVFSLGLLVKGKVKDGKYLRVDLDRKKFGANIAVDIFVATEENYAMTQFIRTGSAAFCSAIFSRLNRIGITSTGSVLSAFKSTTVNRRPVQIGDKIPIETEQDVFDLIGEKWIDPQDRNAGTAEMII